MVRTSHEQTTSGVSHLSVDLSYHLDTHSRHESLVKKEKHRRIWIEKEVFKTWQELIKTWLYGNDSAFVSHLLLLELVRRER